MDQDKLGKIVALAKHGVGGEKESALRLVKRMCKKHNLDFDEVMNSAPQTREYIYYYKTKAERKIAGQIIFKILNTTKIGVNDTRKVFIFDATPEQSVEIFSAIPVYLRAFHKEKKRISDQLPTAFVIKHQLWSDANDDSEQPELTPEQIKESVQKHKLARNLVENVVVHKQIGNNREVIK